MISSETISRVRTVGFAICGLVCLAYAVSAFLEQPALILPSWLPPVTGILVALLLFLTSWSAGPNQSRAAFDESYQLDQRTAGTAGFWAALVVGTLLWLTGWGAGHQLGITLTFASACFLWTQTFLDLRAGF